MNIQLAKVRQKKNIALAIASSGIAATLLDGGRTTYSVLSAPISYTTRKPSVKH